MKIVDSQIHLWESGTSTGDHQRAFFTTADAVRGMNEAGVDGAVIVPPSWAPDSQLALSAVHDHPGRFGVMGRINLAQELPWEKLATWKQQPGMLGLRFVLQSAEQKAPLADGTGDWFWPMAERAGIPVMVFATAVLPDIDRIAERHPGLRLVIDHMGAVVTTQDDALLAHLPHLLPLARRPNVAVKLSGAPSNSSDVYPYRNIHDPLHRMFDAFGPERSFWGTDITRMPISWRQCVTMFTEELPWLKGRDLELVMGQAVQDWLGWTG